MKQTFAQRIEAMNEMYKLPINTIPTLSPDVIERLPKFMNTLMDEVMEICDITTAAKNAEEDIIVLTMMADLLGDMVVYCRSEALKYGIPLEAVLDIIMDSNESKLGADGLPIYNDDGKFLKGPNYWKPEPKIHELLEAARLQPEPVLGVDSEGGSHD